jgi:hypothetical protein
MRVGTWKMIEDAPGAVIDAAKHLPATPIGPTPFLCLIEMKGRTPQTYLQWAREGLADANERGYDSALMYAKRAVCRRIDALLLNNHLRKFEGETYPVKLEKLRTVGILAPDVLHQLVIDPRNQAEHRYEAVYERDARRAVELADLFLRATAEEANRSAVVAFNWNIQLQDSSLARLDEFGPDPMLIVDIFQKPERVKILRPTDGEVQCAELMKFSNEEAIEFAQFVRTLYSPDWESAKRDEAYFLRVIKAAQI